MHSEQAKGQLTNLVRQRLSAHDDCAMQKKIDCRKPDKLKFN